MSFSQAFGVEGVEGDRREEYARRFPGWLQGLITSATGKAAQGQQPLWQSTPLETWLFYVALWMLGLAGALTVATQGGLWMGLLPLFWLWMTGAQRAFQTSLLHHGSHGTLAVQPWLNALLSEIVSVLGMLIPLDLYRELHLKHHKSLALSSDPDLQILISLGFRPGMTVAQAWWHLAGLLFNPRLQLRMALSRWASGLFARSLPRRLAGWGWLLLLAWLVAQGWGVTLLLVYGIPQLLFQQAGVLQLVSEHTYVYLGWGRDSRRAMMSRLTYNRYFGAAIPKSGAGVGAWAWFVIANLGHLSARVGVVPGDLANHAIHHFAASDRRWPMAAYLQRDVLQAEADRGSPVHEVWGLAAAISTTFRHLAAMPADAELGEPETYGFIDPDLALM